jgi:hypothetical protein
MLLSLSPAGGEGGIIAVPSPSPLSGQHEEVRLSRLRAFLRAPKGLRPLQAYSFILIGSLNLPTQNSEEPFFFLTFLKCLGWIVGKSMYITKYGDK